MLDVLDSLKTWLASREKIGVATVIQTWGSAPRPVGSRLVITRGGGVAGSVSAGCVEGAVIEECLAVLKSGIPKMLTFGVADDTAWDVGLVCGGTIQVFVEPFSAYESVFPALLEGLESRQAMALVHVLAGPTEYLNKKMLVLPTGRSLGNLEIPVRNGTLLQEALTSLDRQVNQTIELENCIQLFIEVYSLPPRLIIVGAVHFAEPLVTMANAAGFDTIVIDPRKAFATRQRFPHASQLWQEWPQQALERMTLDGSAYVVVLTHDPKLDDPALQIALQSQARYIGALGSRRTNRLRLERLREAGLAEEQLQRIHAPVGLNLGGKTTGEIAVSILAEVIQVKNSI